MAPERMSFAVLGPGGVGGLLAALLSRGGDRVVVLHDSGPREIHVESNRFGDFTAEVHTAPRLAEPVDAVLVTVKATHLDDALDRVPAAALGDALVIPFLNGIEHVELLRSVYPASSVVPATIRIETTKVAPGVIHHTSPFAVVDIGPRGEPVAAHLRATGLDVRIKDDENAMLWDKMAVLAPMALLTTHESRRSSVSSHRWPLPKALGSIPSRTSHSSRRRRGRWRHPCNATRPPAVRSRSTRSAERCSEGQRGPASRCQSPSAW